jgi:hypothetical protein
MNWDREWAIALSGLMLVGCTTYDYDPNQRRDWQQLYILSDSQYPTNIDTFSIHATDEGVQFDTMSKFRNERGEGQFIETLSLNCTTGAYFSIKRTWVGPDGKVTQQESSPTPSQVYESIAPAYQSVCVKVGKVAGFAGRS